MQIGDFTVVALLMTMTVIPVFTKQEPLIAPTTDGATYPIITHSDSWIDYEYADGSHTRTLYGGTMFTNESGKWCTLPEVSNLTWTDGCFNFSYRNYWVHIEPFVVYNGVNRTIQEIKNAFPNVNIANYISFMKFDHKFALNFSNVPQSLINNTNYIGLHLKSAHGLTWDDVQKTNNHSLVIKNKVEINYHDLIESNFTLRMPDKRTLLIGNISNNSADGTIYLDPTVSLHTNETEILEDFYAGKSEAYALQPGVYIVKFNLSSIPIGSTTSDSELNFYVDLIDDGGDNDLNIYRIPSQTWTEDDDENSINTTWNAKTDLDATQSFTGSTGWQPMNVTTKVQTELTASNANVSFGLEDPDIILADNAYTNGATTTASIGNACGSGSARYYQRLCTKEHATTSQRPYLNITYSGAVNNAPTQSGESPVNGSTDMPVTPSLYVICSDSDSDTMTATWRSNSSGAWDTFATNSSISTGTNITQTNSNFSAYSTTYWWSVNLTDGANWTNETYHFTTKALTWQTISDAIGDGTLKNTTTWQTISDTLGDGSISNTTQWQTISSTLGDGNLGNTTTWQTISDNLGDGTLANTTSWQIVSNTVGDGTLKNTTSWHTISSIIGDGTISNITSWQTISDTIGDGYISNTTHWNVISIAIGDGSISNTTSWHIISNALGDGSLGNLTAWQTISTTVGDGYIKNTTFDTEKPTITWISPTPTDGDTISNDYAHLNTTITDDSNTSAFFDWNNSLVGYWAMDWYNSTGIFDNSTYSNFGEFKSWLTVDNITTGKFGNGIAMRGNSTGSGGYGTYIDCGNDTSLQPTNALTIDCWINPSEAQEDDGNHGVASSADDWNSSSSWSWQMRYGAPPDLYLGFQLHTVAGTAFVNISQNLTPNNWYHIVATFDGRYSMIYLNGTLVNTHDFGNTTIATDANNHIFIGDEGWANYFNGTIDEFKIFNRALSYEEINASYNNSDNRLYHNFTGLPDGTYNYSAYVIDTYGNLNITSQRNVTIAPLSWHTISDSVGDGTLANTTYWTTISSTLGDGYIKNTTQWQVISDTLGSGNLKNTTAWRIISSTTGDGALGNTTGWKIISSVIGDGSLKNTTGWHTISDSLGYGNISNTTGWKTISNTIGDGTLANVLTWQTISNDIGDGTLKNSTGWRIISDTIGDGTLKNTTYWHTISDTLGNGYIKNTTGWKLISDTLGDGNISNTSVYWKEISSTVGDGTLRNTLHIYFYNLLPADGSTDICPCVDSMCFGVENMQGHNMNVTVYHSDTGDDFHSVKKYYNITDGTYCFCLCGHEFVPAYLYEYANDSDNVSVGVWKNVTFSNESDNFYNINHTWYNSDNDTFKILYDGMYRIAYRMSFEDTATAPTSESYARIVVNGNEVPGSLQLKGLFNKNEISSVSSHITAYLYAGDKVKLQFTGDSDTIELSSHTKYGDTHTSVIFNINRIDDSDMHPMPYNTTYYWYVNVTDTVTGRFYNSGLYNFTTAESPSDCISTGGAERDYVVGLIGVIGVLGILGYLKRRRSRK